MILQVGLWHDIVVDMKEPTSMVDVFHNILLANQSVDTTTVKSTRLRCIIVREILLDFGW